MLSRRAAVAAMTATPFAIAGRSLADADPDDQADDAFAKKGLYLPFYRALQRETDDTSVQKLAQLLAMMGDEDAAFRTMPATVSRKPPDLTGCTARDALEAIADAAKDRQIVILNEAHNVSRCRAFALDVALKLSALGFEIFTAESLSADPADGAAERLNGGGPIASNIGWYVHDPVYAELLRNARAAGYRFATYEIAPDQGTGATMEEQIANREEAEADNFIANILSKNPKARVFAYCGYAHLMKVPVNRPNGPLPLFAARLKQKTGIDPLCIIQDAGAPPPDPTLETLWLKTILDRFQPPQPIVVTDGKGQPYGNGPSGGFDFAVYHPRLPNVEGRPGWLARARRRKAFHYDLPEAVGMYALLQAVPADETSADNTVPSDQLPLTAGARGATFFLRPGAYQIRLETDTGRRILGSITV